MKTLATIFCLLAFFFTMNVTVKESAAKKQTIDRGQPIQIVSDRLDAYNEKRLVVFSGNAVATQGDKVIRSDQILLFYRKDQPIDTRKPRVGEELGELERIEARGKVIVTYGDRIVTGDDAVFFQDLQKIVMTGDAVMREGKNVVKGDRITVFLKENRGVVESTESGRVKATIYPEDSNRKTTPDR